VEHLSGATFYGRLLTLHTNIRLGWKRIVGDIHFSFLRKFIYYRQKKFYDIGPWLEKLVRNKRSSLFAESVNNKHKSLKPLVSGPTRRGSSRNSTPREGHWTSATTRWWSRSRRRKIWCRCHKTFFLCHWWWGLIGQRVCPWKPFPAKS